MAGPTPSAPVAANPLAAIAAGPLGPWIALLAAPMLAAGYGADAAVVRAGATESQITQGIRVELAPLRVELDAARAERAQTADNVRELRADVRALIKLRSADIAAPADK